MKNNSNQLNGLKAIGIFLLFPSLALLILGTLLNIKTSEIKKNSIEIMGTIEDVSNVKTIIKTSYTKGIEIKRKEYEQDYTIVYQYNGTTHKSRRYNQDVSKTGFKNGDSIALYIDLDTKEMYEVEDINEPFIVTIMAIPLFLTSFFLMIKGNR